MTQRKQRDLTYDTMTLKDHFDQEEKIPVGSFPGIKTSILVSHL